MLATHNPKTLNAGVKQSAICADIIAPVPPHLICSKTINMRQKYWAAPSSAAYIKTERALAVQANLDMALGLAVSNDIPEINDPRLKQIILPFSDEYYSLTPVPSMGVLHEIFKRSSEIEGAYLPRHVIQQNAMAFANHGELMLAQAGRVRCFHTYHGDHANREYTHQYYEGLVSKNNPDYLVFEATVVGMNVSSGMVAIGLPAITAIGGWVHFLERETGQNIEFAIGLTQVAISESKQKYVDQSRQNKPQLVKGVAANVRFVADETLASVKLAIIFKTENHDTLKKYLLNNEFRIAGGTVWDKKFSRYIPEADWLYETNTIATPVLHNYEIDKAGDVLDHAIKLNILKKGKKARFTINSTGYALLSNPEQKPYVRDIKFKHAFAEPLFSILQLHPVFEPDLLFWKRKNLDDRLIYWGNR